MGRPPATAEELAEEDVHLPGLHGDGAPSSEQHEARRRFLTLPSRASPRASLLWSAQAPRPCRGRWRAARRSSCDRAARST
eukprot:2604109-Alexandrium_andersonii.AAC.1